MASKKPAAAVSVARSVDGVTSQMASAKVSVIGLFDDVVNKINNALTDLRATQAEIDAKKAELKELHAIEGEALQIEALQAHKTEISEALDEELAERTKVREREEEEYQYALLKAQRASSDAWDEIVRKRKAELQQDIDERMASVVAREKAIGDAEAKIKALTDELAAAKDATVKEVGKAVAIATNSLKKDLEHSFALERAQLTNSNALLVAEKANLAARLEDAHDENMGLANRLKEATESVKSIAEKAIDGAAQQRVTVNATAPELSTKR